MDHKPSGVDDSKSTAPGPVADCYSAGERSWMLATQRGRARLLAPVLIQLTRWRVSANGLTALSFIAGIAFAPVWFANRPAALLLLGLHVLLDGLDGPLARFQGKASRGGSFTDTMSDQAVVTAVALTLMIDQVVAILPGGIYLFCYAVVALFAMVRNALGIPYAWLVRPRFIVYAWIPVAIWVWPGTMDTVLWACNALLVIKALTGFRRIRAQI
jgi:phosphatidylglycerophosphate synthase